MVKCLVSLQVTSLALEVEGYHYSLVLVVPEHLRYRSYQELNVLIVLTVVGHLRQTRFILVSARFSGNYLWVLVTRVREILLKRD